MAEPSRFRPVDAALERELIAPEGVMLRLQLATVGQRFWAFMIDFVLLHLAIVALTVVLLFVFGIARLTAAPVLVAVWLLGSFALRNTWFILFEAGVRGATPGKRLLGIRVAARDGGRLPLDAIIARNMMRELEVFLPLSFLGWQASQGQGAALTALVGLGWSLVFALFPLFNRDRLRVGDLIAGTWVLRSPRPGLGLDIAERRAVAAPEFAFSDAQLDAYGEYELQTLEDVLRRAAPDALRRPADDPVVLVAASIRRKIAWRGREDDYAFLSAYYTALRARLERGLLFDRRRRDKRDRT